MYGATVTLTVRDQQHYSQDRASPVAGKDSHHFQGWSFCMALQADDLSMA
jgi:hypothetical protein